MTTATSGAHKKVWRRLWFWVAAVVVVVLGLYALVWLASYTLTPA